MTRSLSLHSKMVRAFKMLCIESRLWTVGQVAKFFGCKSGTITRWRRDGKIPYMFLENGEYRYNIYEVVKAMGAHKTYKNTDTHWFVRVN